VFDCYLLLLLSLLLLLLFLNIYTLQQRLRYGQQNYYYYYYYALTLFSRLLMLTLIFLGIINFLPLYRLSYFVFHSFNYFCVFLCTRANFVISLCAVKFARK
jgi:hypothetical protein